MLIKLGVPALLGCFWWAGYRLREAGNHRKAKAFAARGDRGKALHYMLLSLSSFRFNKAHDTPRSLLKDLTRLEQEIREAIRFVHSGSGHVNTVSLFKNIKSQKEILSQTSNFLHGKWDWQVSMLKPDFRQRYDQLRAELPVLLDDFKRTCQPFASAV